jgi:hypothetical protein
MAQHFQKSVTISICQPIIDFALHIKSVLKFQTIPKTLGIHSVNDVIVLRNDDVIDFQNENLAIILSKSVHVHNQ